MKNFSQFLKEQKELKNINENPAILEKAGRGKKVSKPKPTEYYHIGPANLRPGQDLLSMKDQHGEHKAFNKFVSKWNPLYYPGIENDIDNHISNVHITGPDYFGIGKDGKPKKGSSFSKTEYGGRRNTALYKITPDAAFHNTTTQFQGDRFDGAHPDHYLTPRVRARHITHRWNEKKQTWEIFNQKR